MNYFFSNLTRREKIGFFALILIMAVLFIVSLVMVFGENEPIAKIRNLDEYMVSASGEEKKNLQKKLYTFLDGIFSDIDISELGIYIRDNTFIETQADEAYLTNFIIDIDELEISYAVSYVFPTEAATSENPVFDCPALKDMKYPETECIGMYNSSTTVRLEAENPIYAVLPISVDRYDVGRRQSVKYDIFGIIDEEKNKFLVRIIDYGGYSYENALQSIRDKGFDPDDYEIEYISYGGE